MHDDSVEASASVPAPSLPQRVWIPIGLFLVTVVTVLMAGTQYTSEQIPYSQFYKGWPFAVSLLSILVTHELGHMLAARWHHVPSSLPHFIPLPPQLGLGTMGALISVRQEIRSRRALMDIGASGPLAGFLVAVVVLVVGLRLSPVERIPEHGLTEGNSLFYLFIKRIVVGSIPDQMDVVLHPVAYAGWVGCLLTMINLLPAGQLDGGHVAYALWGKRAKAIGRWIHASTLLMFLINFIPRLWLVLWKGEGVAGVQLAFSNSNVWLVWWVLLMIVRRASKDEHPPTHDETLGRWRTILGYACFGLLVVLFTPTPMTLR